MKHDSEKCPECKLTKRMMDNYIKKMQKGIWTKKEASAYNRSYT